MKQRELTNEYVSSFCMELSMLLQTGIPPYDCALMLYDDEADNGGKEVLQSVIDGLETGAPLSEALRASGYFPQYMITMTEAGEKTGRTSEALKALSEHYDRQERLYSIIKDAVFYPSVLFVLMVVVVLILIVRVLPVFSGVFNRMGAQMPPFAEQLMLFGGLLANFFAVIAVVMGVLIIAAFAAWRFPSVRKSIKSAFANTFGDKGIFKKITVSRIVSVMALATASGIEPENAMELAAMAAEGSERVRKRCDESVDALRSGLTLSEAMFKAGFLSARNSRLLSVAARSGMTDTAMAEIAARYDRETQDEINRLVGRIEPSLVIISSVMVGAILLMVMLPLVSIMSSIS